MSLLVDRHSIVRAFLHAWERRSRAVANIVAWLRRNWVIAAIVGTAVGLGVGMSAGELIAHESLLTILTGLTLVASIAIFAAAGNSSGLCEARLRRSRKPDATSQTRLGGVLSDRRWH